MFRVPPDGEGRLLIDVLRDAGFDVPAICGGRGTCGGCAVRVDPAPPPGEADRRLLPETLVRQGWRLSCLLSAAAGTAVAMPAGRAPEGARASAVAGTHRPRRFALAVDAGTTNVACALVGLPAGAVLAEASVPNRQGTYGADVISRIEYASRGPRELARLRDALAASIHEAAAAACRAAGVPVRAPGGGAVAGNPAMVHMLAGADPTPLGRAPFALAFAGPVVFPAGRLGFPGDAKAQVSILPQAGITLGGDAIGGAVVLGMDRGTRPRLLVDVGTNTEMILVAPRPGTGVGGTGRPAAWAASAASGGAFEGANISCGMRVAPGAVTGVAWEDDDVRLRVAGGGPPAGLAGSGLLDAVALLLRFGVLDRSGRLRSRPELFGAAPPAMAGRLVAVGRCEAAFLLARAGGRVLALSASDVRRFQLAKAAIRAGLDLLLEEAGISAADVASVQVAGAFGRGISEEAAIVSGLFPATFRGKLSRAGNAALAAAAEAVRSPEFLARAARFARRLTVVSLADHPAFPSRFLGAMDFPGPA